RAGAAWRRCPRRGRGRRRGARVSSPTSDIAEPSAMTKAPAVGPLPHLQPPRPTRFALASGLEVAAVQREVAPLVAVNVMFRSGSDTDPPALAGLGGATADMLDEGAGTRDSLAVAEELEQLGADLWLSCG